MKEDFDNLFDELEISKADQDNGRRKADTLDFKLQASAILHDWRKRKGKDATRNAIINALRECDFHHAVEILQTEWCLTTE